MTFTESLIESQSFSCGIPGLGVTLFGRYVTIVAKRRIAEGQIHIGKGINSGPGEPGTKIILILLRAQVFKRKNRDRGCAWRATGSFLVAEQSPGNKTDATQDDKRENRHDHLF